MDYQEKLRIYNRAKIIVSSELKWDEKYDLIFSDEISNNFSFEWYDPDLDYEDDVLAYMRGFDEYMKKQEIINDIDSEAKEKEMEKDLEYIDELEGKPETKIRWDRTRSVNYNGNELYMNTYGCNSCKEQYYFEQIIHKFCPFCGTKFKYEIDVSI
jgi:hypothetical protein